MNFKHILLGILLLIGAAFALTVNSPEAVQTVVGGEAIAFELVLAGNGETVDLTVDSELPVSLSQNFIEVSGVEYVDVIAYTKNFDTSAYGIEVTAETDDNTYTYQLSVVIKGQEASLKLDLVYDELELIPGEEAEIEFVLTNTGTQTLKNVIIKSDFLKSFEPDYPNTLVLTAGEEEELTIDIEVPLEAAEEEYIFTITAATGDIEVSKEIEIEVAEEEDIENAIDLDVEDSWKAIKDQDDNIIGYEIAFTVENDESITLKDVEVEFSNMPSDWEVKGDLDFDIEPYDEEEYEIKVYPANFDEITTRMKLVHNDRIVASESLSFAGYKVGAPTGFFFVGGSLTIGILLVVIIILVVLFLRQKSQFSEKVEDVKTKAYLEDLVKKAQSERKTSRKKK